jgi:phage protein D
MEAAPILPLEVFVGEDFYVPSFRILLRGEEKIENRDVLSVTYTDNLDEIDSFSMTVNDWDAETLKPKYSDTSTFNPWNDIEVWMGYYNGGQAQLRRMLIGEITTFSPNFPSSGGPTLTVGGLNLFHRFRAKQITRPFLQKKDSEIAQALVGEIAREINSTPKNGPKIELRIDPQDMKTNLKDEHEQVIPYLLVNNQYPIRFLMERARRIGYELTLEELPKEKERTVTFHFRPTSEVKRKTYVLEWGKSLISFQPTLQIANQVSEVTVRGWDPSGKKKFEEKATRAEIAGEIVSLAELGVSDASLTQKREITVDKPIQTKAEAKELALKTLRQIAQETVTARAKTIGLPDLRAGTKVEIRNLGKRFSGIYLVTGTTHTLGDGGYTTDFTARMEKLL